MAIGPWRKLTRSPAVAAFALAPVLGELLSNSQPLPGFLLSWLPLALLYGCGAILIHEAAVRWGTGWTAVILLGLAYGIYEEGLVVRSFFDPEWEDLGALAVYGRGFGINWLWAELLTLFHAAISIGATLVITEALFPRQRQLPWVGRRGLAWNAAALGIWLPLGAVEFMSATAGQLAGATVIIGALVLAAARARSPLIAPRSDPAAAPRRFLTAGALATAVVFLWVFIAAEEGSPPDWVTGVGVAAVVGSTVWWVLRRSGRAGTWDDRHRVALVSGMLGFMALMAAPGGGPLGPVVSIGTVGALRLLYRRTARRLEGAEMRVP